jgi:hypothetical protein
MAEREALRHVFANTQHLLKVVQTVLGTDGEVVRDTNAAVLLRTTLDAQANHSLDAEKHRGILRTNALYLGRRATLALKNQSANIRSCVATIFRGLARQGLPASQASLEWLYATNELLILLDLFATTEPDWAIASEWGLWLATTYTAMAKTKIFHSQTFDGVHTCFVDCMLAHFAGKRTIGRAQARLTQTEREALLAALPTYHNRDVEDLRYFLNK